MNLSRIRIPLTAAAAGLALGLVLGPGPASSLAAPPPEDTAKVPADSLIFLPAAPPADPASGLEILAGTAPFSGVRWDSTLQGYAGGLPDSAQVNLAGVVSTLRDKGLDFDRMLVVLQQARATIEDNQGYILEPAHGLRLFMKPGPRMRLFFGYWGGNPRGTNADFYFKAEPQLATLGLNPAGPDTVALEEFRLTHRAYIKVR